MIRPVHPFPARMAPELALEVLRRTPTGIVLDPMAGSGTVLRHASQLGHRAIGFDVDPLAVLMAKVWTTPVDPRGIERLLAVVAEEARNTRGRVNLPWIDNDAETRRFVRYWFAQPQRLELRRLAHALALRRNSRRSSATRAAADVLTLALSRIIITKDRGASLARDVSHSRPHKVTDDSAFDVMRAFEQSARCVQQLLATDPPRGEVHVRQGDARFMKSVGAGSVDLVLTSPPYLNAIDYMRGHRMSLVWCGYGLSELRKIRATSIGAERAPDSAGATDLFGPICDAMCDASELPSRQASMVTRYAEDVYRSMSEISRVLKPATGRATLVVGNSCLSGVFIRNSCGVIRAASMVGLRLVRKTERELPNGNRYLPMPPASDVPLGKRMRTETVLTFTVA